MHKVKNILETLHIVENRWEGGSKRNFDLVCTYNEAFVSACVKSQLRITSSHSVSRSWIYSQRACVRRWWVVLRTSYGQFCISFRVNLPVIYELLQANLPATANKFACTLREVLATPRWTYLLMQVNCKWGPNTCSPQVKMTLFVGMFARASITVQTYQHHFISVASQISFLAFHRSLRSCNSLLLYHEIIYQLFR